MTPATIQPTLESGQNDPMMSVVSSRQWIRIMLAAMDVGMPKPTTRPKLMANDIAASSFLDISLLKYWPTIGRKPSLKTAIPLLDRMAASPPIRAMTTYLIVYLLLFSSGWRAVRAGPGPCAAQ